MSLKDARGELLATLEAAGIDTFYGWGTFAAPCARVFPSDPWVAPSGLAGGKRTQQWEVWAVAGRVDAAVTFEEMEALVQEISTALDPLRNWSNVEWRRPAFTDMGGARYIACRGTLQTLTEV